MTKRAKILTALIAVIGLIVVAPLSAAAYWSATAPVALTAQARTFTVSPFSVTPASASSSTSFVGWETTQYYAAPLVNSGSTPWASASVAVAAASGFGPAAVATLQVAFTASSTACQNDATYTGVSARSALAASTWPSPSAAAPGATVHACIKLVVTDTDSHSDTGQAPAPTLTLTTTATAAQHNWTAQEQAQLTIASTGWAACSTNGSNVVLTLPSGLPSGSYTVTRDDTGAAFPASISPNGKTLTLSNPATRGVETAETYVSVRNAQGTVVAVANLSFRSSYFLVIFFNKSLACA
jgi:hypothetical protein